MLNDFLARLDNVKKNGDDYYAICPVSNHSGKRRTLSVREKSGVIMAHCFSCGAKSKEVANAIGYKFKVNESLAKHREKIPYYSKDQRMFDAYFIQVVEDAEFKVPLKEKLKYRQCKQRMDNYNERVKEYYDSRTTKGHVSEFLSTLSRHLR